MDHRPVMLMTDDVVVVDVFQSEVPGRIDPSFLKHKSVVSFYPRTKTILHDDETYPTLVLKSCTVLSMHRFGEEHVLLLCSETPADDVAPLIRNDDNDEFADLDGHWFAPDSDNFDNLSIATIVVVHVPSRREIHRILFADFIAEQELKSFGFSLFCVGDTIGVGLGWAGVLMTGEAIRDIIYHKKFIYRDTILPNSSGSKNKKKEKKARHSGRNKKDGFARGQSMRG